MSAQQTMTVRKLSSSPGIEFGTHTLVKHRQIQSVTAHGSVKNREVPRNKSSRKGAESVPFPQKERIKQKFIAGKNISQIAREEGRHWETVSRIVKEQDVAAYVRSARERFCGSLDEMMSVVIDHAKHANDGGWLAYEMLKSAGVIPSASANQMNLPVESTKTPEEEAVRETALRMLESGIRRLQAYEMELPEPDPTDTV